jgi:hypothetical protein
VDLLSIDVDSIDFWVWRELLLAGYRAQLVVVEYNRQFPHGISATMPRLAHRDQLAPLNTYTSFFGASATAFEILAAEFNYHLIYADSWGVNLFFVPRELLCSSPHTVLPPHVPQCTAPIHAAPPPGQPLQVYLGQGRAVDMDPVQVEQLWRREETNREHHHPNCTGKNKVKK